MKYPYAILTSVALVSLTVLVACQSGDWPVEEIDAPAKTAPAATVTPAPTTTSPSASTPATATESESETAPVHSSSFDATKYENVWVHAIEEKEHEGRSLLRVSYPLTEKDAINARMEAVTQQFIDEWRAMATETEASYQKYKEETGREAATFITHYRQHFDVSIANENLIFFDIVRSIHTGGTGNSFVVGYIFDRRTGAELTIADLFVDDSYLERLSTLSREALGERISNEELASDPEWVESGTAPAAENFDNILLLADGTILVRFDKYQVAAGVEGVVEVALPIDSIADLLKEDIRDLLGLKAEAAAPTKIVVNVAVSEVTDNDGRSTLYVSYPVTDKKTVNQRIVEITQPFIDEFHETAAEIETAYQDYKKETGKEAASLGTIYHQDHEVTIANERVLFFEVARSTSTGNTFSTLVSSYIFDLRQGTELFISDLFVDDRYLQRLSELTREALAERLRNQIAEREPDADDDRKEALFESETWMFETGTEPTAENFDFIVYRDDGTFLVRFDKYQVASGVDGVVEVVLSVAAIADLLRAEVRDLLGIETGMTSKQSAIAQAENPEALSTLSPAATWNSAQVTVFQNFPRLSLLKFGRYVQAESTAQDEVNCREVACVALTFDDGPSYYTEGLLDILKEHNVKATFFVLGTQVRIQSETVQRMFREGHQIGNHTWDHPNLTKMSDDQIREQLRQTDNLIAQIIGESTPFLRPPYGAYNDNVLAASGLPIIFWSVDPLDWRDRDAATVAARIVDAPAGAIILAHDIHKSTVDAVPAIIAALKSRGIHMVTVTKLFEPQTLNAQNVYIRQPDSPSQ